MVLVKNHAFWHVYTVLTGKYKLVLLWRCELGYNKQRAGREWFSVRLNVDLSSSGHTHATVASRFVYCPFAASGENMTRCKELGCEI